MHCNRSVRSILSANGRTFFETIARSVGLFISDAQMNMFWKAVLECWISYRKYQLEPHRREQMNSCQLIVFPIIPTNISRRFGLVEIRKTFVRVFSQEPSNRYSAAADVQCTKIPTIFYGSRRLLTNIYGVSARRSRSEYSCWQVCINFYREINDLSA